jgi:hypothetical protein
MAKRKKFRTLTLKPLNLSWRELSEMLQKPSSKGIVMVPLKSALPLEERQLKELRRAVKKLRRNFGRGSDLG